MKNMYDLRKYVSDFIHHALNPLKCVCSRKVCIHILAVVVTMCMFMLTSCVSTHPLLKPESINAAMQVAMPYVVSDCQEIELYAGYRLGWGDVDSNGDPDFLHGFGGFVGGCGELAKVACYVGDVCIETDNCKPVVECKVIKLLYEKPMNDNVQTENALPSDIQIE